MDEVLKDKLNAIGVTNLTAAELYIYAFKEGLDVSNINISKIDIKRLKPLIDGNRPDIDQEIQDRIEEYRCLFENTRGKGETGSRSLVLRNLLKFFNEHTNYTFDDLLSITKEYIAEFYGDFRYIKQADYFLYKYVDGRWTSEIKEFIKKRKNDLSKEKTWI
jgi:hypothetical protein